VLLLGLLPAARLPVLPVARLALIACATDVCVALQMAPHDAHIRAGNLGRQACAQPARKRLTCGKHRRCNLCWVNAVLRPCVGVDGHDWLGLQHLGEKGITFDGWVLQWRQE
jgi:hypothetical protein